MIKFALINEVRVLRVEPEIIGFYLGIPGKTGVHATNMIDIYTSRDLVLIAS